MMNLKHEDIIYDIDHYAGRAADYAIYPDAGTGSKSELAYLTLGLCGESGEVAEKIKKFIRDGKFDAQDVAKELGDVFWYLTQLCLAIGKHPSGVLTNNLKKLDDRRERDMIRGEGDNR
jgi:NTP pyrophosphatase (non-canonical NTP hydrolase)